MLVTWTRVHTIHGVMHSSPCQWMTIPVPMSDVSDVPELRSLQGSSGGPRHARLTTEAAARDVVTLAVAGALVGGVKL
jgi:hypothetical protein